MYGHMHVCARSMVCSRFGEKAWESVVKACGLNPVSDFMVFHRYDDALTWALIHAVCEVTGLPLDTTLDMFGEHFFRYCCDQGYDKMLQTLGNDFFSFIQNLDALHAMLAFSYTRINAPSFRCEKNADDSMTLHYYTTRPGLHAVVPGILRAVGKSLFKSRVTLEIDSIEDEILEDMRTQQHVTYRVTLQSESMNNHNTITHVHNGPDTVQSSETRQFTYCETVPISSRNFCKIFPYHFVFDKNLSITHCGEKIQELCPGILLRKTKVNEVTALLQPRMTYTLGNMLKFINAMYILHIQSGRSKQDRKVTLKGQMIWMEDAQQMLCMCSPRITGFDDLQQKQLFLSDIPLHDVTRELILLYEQRNAEMGITKKLDEATAALKQTSQELELEKKKTDSLLYQMLPIKVAEQLREGRRVPAEKFDEVTVLFSDIVSFTRIAAAVQPIDIVNMLNALYQRFDKLTTAYSTYKVETIGDAYMVVGGVPERTTTHAQSVANMALEMIEKAEEVTSPVNNQSLQIRAGIHCGPVVAGVVGDKMPRYCLFGDTVNTASRMESNGVPGKIHISNSVYTHLEKLDYKMEERGEIQVKGKGVLKTYFLLARPNKQTAAESSGAEKSLNDVKDLTLANSHNGSESNSINNQSLINNAGLSNVHPNRETRDEKVKSSSKLCILI